MSGTASPSSGKPYGVATVCRIWRVARATVYRHRAPARPTPPRRPGPAGPVSDPGLVEAIRRILHDSPFHGEGHRKVWARLRNAGTRTSKRRVLRLMRENALLAPSRAGSPRGPRAHDGTIIPGAVDVMWGTDLTTTITGQGQAAVFVAVDHHSAECVGIHAALRATRFEALEPLRQGVRRHFGAFAKDIARGLALRHDHPGAPTPLAAWGGGSTFMAEHFQKQVRFWGISPSYAFVGEPETNGVIERLFRTLKEQIVHGRVFQTIDEVRDAVREFLARYNAEWLIEKNGSRSPLHTRAARLDTNLSRAA